jgi:hypothetical protein
LSDGIEYVRARQPLRGRVELREYDEDWPTLYAREEERLRHVPSSLRAGARRSRALNIEWVPLRRCRERGCRGTYAVEYEFGDAVTAIPIHVVVGSP